MPELLPPVLVLGSRGREEGEDGWWGGGRWGKEAFLTQELVMVTCALGSYSEQADFWCRGC